MKKRLLVILLAAAVLFTFMPVMASAGTPHTWDSTHTYYYNSNGDPIKDCWFIINGVTYHFRSDGKVDKGWFYTNGGEKCFYGDPNTGAQVTGWKKIGGYWYYFARANGNSEDGQYYEIGCMYDHGAAKISGKWYYFGKKGNASKWGKLQYGWIKDGSDWYYGDPDKDGQLVTGWKKIGGKWYYFETASENYYCIGQMYEDGPFTISKSGKPYVYFFSKDGDLRSGWIRDPNYSNVWYYADPDRDCQLITGWKKIDGCWYYFNDPNYYMYADTIMEIGSKYYAFDKNGKLHDSTGWVKLTAGWVYTDSNGIAASGWKKIGGEWYYFYAPGYMAAENWTSDSKGTCWMDKDGHITKGKWIKTGGEWYYLKPNGYRAENQWVRDSIGWMYVDEYGLIKKNQWWFDYDEMEWYFLKENGYMACNEWAEDAIGKQWMGKDGKIVKNQLVQYNGSTYYVDEEGYMVTDQIVTINGIQYYFGPDGRMAAG